MSSSVSGRCSVWKMRLDVPLDGARAEVELLRDRAVRAALGEQREHVALAVGQLVQHRAAVAADEHLHHLRVERRAAAGHALDRVDELGRRRARGPSGGSRRPTRRRRRARACMPARGAARARAPRRLRCERRISTAARSPSSALPGGMRTSTIATSGVYERTLSSRSSASPERPTTSWPASSSSDAMPSRSSALSSATTIRRRGAVARCSVRHGDVLDTWETGAARRRFCATSSASSTPWRRSWPKRIGLSRSTRRCSRRSAAARLGARRRVGGRARRRAAALRLTWHAGDGAPEFEALSERIVLAPGRGAPGPGARERRAGLDRRRARGRELPARGRRAPHRPARRASASRCAARGAWSA